jgi:hypothetical protein
MICFDLAEYPQEPLLELEVDDLVTVFQSYRPRQIQGVVTTVAGEFVWIRVPGALRAQKFLSSTQRAEGSYAIKNYFRTAAQMEYLKKLDYAQQVVRDAGLDVRIGHRDAWNGTAVFALADFLDALRIAQAR